MVGFEGTSLTAEFESFLRIYQPLGIIFFSRNIRNPSQLKTLIDDINECIAETGRTRIIFGIDQEGGIVNRLNPPNFYALPGAMALGRDKSGHLAERAGSYTGRQLSALGIYMDFAPVVDLNTNPYNPQLGLRSFGSDPNYVGYMGQQFSLGLMKTGVLPSAKHFPGLGECNLDTHETLPVLELDTEEIFQHELLPFSALINLPVPVVMTSHVCFSKLDREFPVTLSSKVIQGILREKMGFRGMVVSDDLMMGSISQVMTVPEAAVKAVQAGVNLCLICNSVKTAGESISHFSSACDSKLITPTTVAKQLATIEWLIDKTNQKRRGEIPSFEEGDQISREIAEHAVTMNGSPESLQLNDPNHQLWIIYPEIKDLCPASEGETQDDILESIVSSRDNIKLIKIPINPSPEQSETVLQKINGSNNCIMITYDAFQHEGQKTLMGNLVNSGNNVIQIIAGNPVDTEILEPVACRILTYGAHPCLIKNALSQLGIHSL